MDELVALSVVNTVWERLAGLKSSKEGLSSYLSLINCDGEYCGLVEQLLRDMYHPARREVESGILFCWV